MELINRDSLRGPAQFDPVFSAGRKGSAGCAAARVAPTPAGDVSRLGLIAPKKKAKRAVERNAFKRVAREAFLALLRQRGPGAAALDVVIQFMGVPKERLRDLEAFKKSARADIDKALVLACKRLPG
jgi:ribonuclease P protein component